MPSELGPSSFRPRQTSYLRIGPGQVLQMVLYLEPHDVSWMSTDVLERVLVALRDRIPEKLGKEESVRGKKGKAKEKVDVFRGADFQFAFYFRTTGQKHAVLLKDKQLILPAHKSPQPWTSPANVKKRPRAVSPKAQAPLDLTGDDDGAVEAGTSGERPPKRLDAGPLFSVKDEDVDEPLPEWEVPPVPEEEEEDKPDAEVDEKPRLKVNYTGYSIFSRSLVVIVEPYPRLAQKARGAYPSDAPPTEVHQLSASAPPEAFRRSFSRASSSGSATPAPRRRVAQQPLFRNSTTPMNEEEEEEEVDDNMRSLRERSQALANEDSDDEEDLPMWRS